MNKTHKILLVILLLIIIFVLSAFGMYKYNEYSESKVFNSLASQGKQYMIGKDYDKAIQTFKKALNYKNDPDIQNNLALAQSLKDENAKKQEISKDIQLANDAAKNSKYDDANKYLDEALKIDPNNSDVKNLKDAFAKTVQEQQEKAKYKLEVTNAKNGQNCKDSNSSENLLTQKQAYQIVCNKFTDCDIFVPKRSDYSDEMAEQAGNKYYLFYTEDKVDHSATDYLIGVDKKTGIMYEIYGHDPIKRIS
ncbi:hypothetical protein [Clostridium sp. AWRP]|uniref:tetratricopeptide repeat protein n=1 Tax=Clostridium sp. AWRP TaxID=2212991 RepID=UPI000FD78256|nr:hypothetical protein [Clostridium sp. AWRP]AZV58361.1 hypothetical protein DMR38_18185 [Clostridium sp. AWRP]